MSKIVVIGAGASGIIASIKAGLNNEVILLEKNNKCGKKILITGNGRCNYWNDLINSDKYNTDNYDNLNKILDNKKEVLDFLYDLGIYPKIRNGYYYPNSNQASSVQEILTKALEKNNVNVIYECKVENIIKDNNKFIIKSNIDDIVCDKVIIAGGGMSYPKTGSEGDFYEILKDKHTINKVLPSLVPLVCKDVPKEFNNVRVEGKLELYVDNILIDSEMGEIQLTDYGVSGIPTFNLSSVASRSLYLNKKVELKINFLNEIDNVYTFLDNRNKYDFTSEEILESIIPYQLILELLKEANINRDEKWKKLDENKKEKLINLLTNYNLEVIDTLEFDRAQVSTGGISLSEINPETMESLKQKDLYLIGELLDVDGKCGGFNLGFAFITGYIAGKSV